MADATIELLKTQLRQLRLPTMGREFEKLARDAAATNQTFAQFLLRLTELELATRAINAVATRIKDAGFPVEKDFEKKQPRYHSSRQRSTFARAPGSIRGGPAESRRLVSAVPRRESGR
jgi:DNA replication protein DnaC